VTDRNIAAIRIDLNFK